MSGFETILGIAGSAMSLGGSVADGQAQQVRASYSESHAREQAKQVGTQAAMKELAVRRQTNQVLGAQAAAVAESGTGFGGSNRLLMESDAVDAEMMAQLVRYEGALMINQYDNAAIGLEPQPSSMQRIFGKRGLGQLFTVGSSERWRSGLTGSQNRAW